MYIIIRYSYSKRNYVTSYVKYLEDKEVGQSNGLGQDIVDIIAFMNGKVIHINRHSNLYLYRKQFQSETKQMIKNKLINFISRL